jgi:hypothetical protein
MIDRKDLHAYVDGELGAEQRAAVELFLKSSPEAAREVETIRALKSLVGQKLTPPSTEGIWKVCVRRLDEIEKTRRVERVVGRYAPALCGGLFVVILLAGQFGHQPNRGSITTPETLKMFNTLSPMRPPTSVGFDLSRWYADLLNQSKLSTPDHLTIRGVSSGFMGEVPVRSFSARDEVGDLKILVMQQPVALEGMEPMANHKELQVGLFDGVNCVVRTQGNTTIFIIAERTYDDLASVASKVIVR